MTAINWCYKKHGDTRYAVPSVFEKYYSAWILLKSLLAPSDHRFVPVSLNGRCVELCARTLKYHYGLKTLELEYDPLALNQLLSSKIALLQAQFMGLYRPFVKLYRDEVWFADFLLITLQTGLKASSKKNHFSRHETDTPFSITVLPDRVIVNTKKNLLADDTSLKNFRFAADTQSTQEPLIKVTDNASSEEFEREWNTYNFIDATAQENGPPEGLLVPWSLQIINGVKTIYLPLGKRYDFIKQHHQRNEIALALIKGLLFLHHEFMVHGDPKIDNVVFIKGEAKIIDFGSTVPFGSSLDYCYTQGYHAPEYFLEIERNMPLLDIYALGITLYEINYGCRPSFIYTDFKIHSRVHSAWVESPSTDPLERVIKGFTHPDKKMRMALEEGLRILEAPLLEPQRGASPS